MVTPVPGTAIEKVTDYFNNDVVKARFAEVLGANNAGAFMASVLLAVESSPKLLACSRQSVYISALRAATLRLSVDPSTGQAYLVPYGKVCTLIVGYKGYYDMAVRTLRYSFINVGEVYEGESIEFDRISGEGRFAGRKSGDKVIGWVASFKMRDNGLGKTIYMSVEQIHAHAKKYAPSYNFSDGLWKTNPTVMERKTVLRTLLHQYGYMDPVDVQTLAAIENDAAEVVGSVAAELPGPSAADVSAAVETLKAELSSPEMAAAVNAPVPGEVVVVKHRPADIKAEEEARMKQMGYKVPDESPFQKEVRLFNELRAWAIDFGPWTAEDPVLNLAPEHNTIEKVRAARIRLTRAVGTPDCPVVPK
jgi:recombination protein RecT